MKNKPKWNDLPWCLQERLLYEMDLDYDGYEISKEDVIHSISNGDISDTNKYRIESFYKTFPLETLELYLKQEIKQKENSLKYMKEMLDYL
jgi:hypothetical protein